MNNLGQKIKVFFEESRAEFRHVNWPTRAEATRLTGIVVALSVVLAMFLGLFDYLFASGVSALAERLINS